MSESANLVGEVKVVEYYRDYSPPFDASRAVRLLLRHVPAKHLAGVRSVTLTNSRGTRLVRRGKVRWQNRKVKKADCFGFYRAGHLTLLVDQILAGCPRYLLLLRVVPTYAIGEVLYHEIGHHIHRTQRRDLRDKEFVADEWGKKLLGAFIRKRYWYLSPVAAAYRLFVQLFEGWPRKTA
jgi:hypothetical protein